MGAEEQLLSDLVEAVLEGRPVDWTEAESTVSESQRALLAHLRSVAGIASFHLRSSAVEDLRSDLASASPSPATSEVIPSRSVSAATGEALLEGATWGSLRLLERVAQGAFGDVYRAWDPRLDREVALKLMRQLESRPDSSGSQVIHEGRLLARVRHPNVVTAYGADRIDGRVGLWMEFVQGRTLEAVLREQGPFGAHEAALIGIDLCRALSAVHSAGLIHRDVKAQNVMREANGRIVLMDFGTGREDLSEGPADLAGTPLYLAPEVFGGAPATARSDIYSAGVLLFHLVTGAYPVKGRTVADLREAHGQRRRVWLRDARPDLADPFVQAVEGALEVDPDKRYESAGAMEAALSRAIATTGTAPSEAKSSHVWLTRRKWAAGAVLALAVAIAAIALPSKWQDTLFGRGGSPPAQARAGGGPAASATRVRQVPLDNRQVGQIGRPSADGKLLSLVDNSGNVALMDLATGQLHPVTSDAVLDRDGQFAGASAISADGQFVAYVWFTRDGKQELRVHDIAGKQPDVPVRSEGVDYLPLEWSRDGKSILSLTRSDHSSLLALIRVADGKTYPVKELDSAQPRYASRSPDGEFIVYDYPQQPSASARDIFIIRSDGSDERRLIAAPGTDSEPVWTADGRHVLFASDRSGTLDLWRVSVDRGVVQGAPELVRRNLGRSLFLGLTDTGGYYYYETVGVVDVYDAELGPNAVGKPTSIATKYSGSNISSIWSPDGRRVAYASRRGLARFDRESTTLVIRDLRTGQDTELTLAMNNLLLRSWSPDGRRILVQGEDAQGRTGAHAIDTETRQVLPVILNRPGANDIRRPDWRSDDSVVYINSARRALLSLDLRSRREQVAIDFGQEGINVVANTFGRGFRLSPDGRSLAYTAMVGKGDTSTYSVWIRPLDGGQPRELARVKAPEMILFQDWSDNGTSLLFTRWIARPAPDVSLWRVSMNGGDPQPLGLEMNSLLDVSVHPEGKRITFTAGSPTNELWVLENFLGSR